MNLNILALAVPLSIAFIVLEYFLSRKKYPGYFNLHNSVSNISIGPVSKEEVIKAMTPLQLEDQKILKEYATILAFDVKLLDGV